MTRLKLFPGAAASDSSSNRRWISQQNQMPEVNRGAPPVPSRPANPVAVWEDDGGAAPRLT
jgi:hypothetical protein